MFQRIQSLFKRNPNGGFEDGVNASQLLKLALSEVDVSLSKSNASLQKAEANLASLEVQATILQKEVDFWSEKAIEAIKSGEEALGLKAVDQKNKRNAQLLNYRRLINQSAKSVMELKTTVAEKKDQLRALNAEAEVLNQPISKEPKTFKEDFSKKNSFRNSINEESPLVENNFDTIQQSMEKTSDYLKTEETYQKIISIWGDFAEDQEKKQTQMDEKITLVQKFLNETSTDKESLFESFFGNSFSNDKQQVIDNFFKTP